MSLSRREQRIVRERQAQVAKKESLRSMRAGIAQDILAKKYPTISQDERKVLEQTFFLYKSGNDNALRKAFEQYNVQPRRKDSLHENCRRLHQEIMQSANQQMQAGGLQ